MKFTELKNSIANGAESVYLLEGDDAYFRDKGEEMIKKAFLQMEELNYSSFDGESLKGSQISELVSALKNYPFMAEKRIIKVSEFYPTENEIKTYLDPLFADFPSTAILIIVNSGAGKTDFKRKKVVTFVDCNRADAETVAKWIYITLRRAKIEVSSAVCENIAEYCLCNMARVASETQKLIAYKGEGRLTAEEADALVYKDAEYRLYELTATIPRRDFTKFCLISDELLSKSGNEMMILSSVYSYLRNLLTISRSRESDLSLSKMLKMKEYGVKKSREQAYAIGEKKLENLVKFVYSCISGVKCGKLTPQSALQNAQNALFFGN